MTESLDLQFPACLSQDFAAELPAAQASLERILGALSGASYEALERHSPALKENDWSNYLRCSVARMVHAAGALRRAGVTGGRLLDYGAYFGNFSGMFADLGFTVDAIDGFDSYTGALEGPLALMRERGINILDFKDQGRDLAGLPEASYDVVLCAGVIEHMPHSPLGLLTLLNRVLKPGGHLITDTPNLAHLYKRQSLARGESVWPPLAAQFYSPIPYEGHHREYTAPEVAWMLHEVGHEVLAIELYSYSCYEQPVLTGRDITNFWRTIADPTQREYITVLSRRGAQTKAAGPAPDWRTLFVESEPHWLALQPPVAAVSTGDLSDVEPLLVQLQQDVVLRDALLVEVRAENAELHRQSGLEMAARDQTIDALRTEVGRLNDRIGELQGEKDARLLNRLKSKLRRSAPER